MSAQINKSTDHCMILKAELACWRRKLLSSSLIEQGYFTCWHFIVRHRNGTAKAQHNNLDDFPTERNKCENEESCGMEDWPCRLSRRSSFAALRWHFPISDTIYCSVGFVAASIFALMAMIRYIREGKKKDEEPEDDEDSMFEESITSDGRYIGYAMDPSATTTEHRSVPFSFRKRMPMWMQDYPRDIRDSPSTAIQASPQSAGFK